MVDDRLRVGIVGAGFMGEAHAIGWGAVGANLVGVVGGSQRATRELATRHNTAAFTSVAELIRDVDVVDICTPSHLHPELVHAAAAAKRDVVCEKPLALNVGDAISAARACRDADVKLLVGHVVRFFPEYAHVKRAVEFGEIGEPALLRLERNTYQPAKPDGNWFTDESKSGGIVFDLMIHDLDYARWLAGDIVTVNAKAASTRNKESSTHIIGVFQHASGAISHIQASWAYPRPHFNTRLEVAGTKGTLENDSDKSASVRTMLGSSLTASDVPLPGVSAHESPWTAQLRHFSSVIRGEVAPLVTVEDAVWAVAVAEAVVDSARQQRPVALEGIEVMDL